MMLEHNLRIHKPHAMNTTWNTIGERAGEKGIIWYCEKCGWQQTFFENDDPNDKEMTLKEKEIKE